jgi:hypothetical protein
MAFHKADYDLYVFLGDPASEPLWHWNKWHQLIPQIDALLRVARGPASIRSTQYLPNRTGTIKFGKIVWKEKDQQKWTHLSPSNLEASPRWNFLSAELWAPAWMQCEREGLAPDVFLSISSQGYFGKATSFEPVVVLAVVTELARRDAVLIAGAVEKLRELLNAKLVGHQRRPWGRTALGGLGFENSIQDLHVTGLFKPGKSQERPLGLDLFSGTWDLVAATTK